MKESYFASANGYRGFTSLFNDVFDSTKFEKVFILKGGPGTGKSTFIKKICDKMERSNANIKRFYCSSDTNSLDGAIIELSGKKVAFIDGTAPHERDATYVGAIDELINLGQGLNASLLSSHRDKIIELSKEKNKAYKVAYSHLNIAGECDDHIYKTITPGFDINSACKYMCDLFDMSKSNCQNQEFRIFRSSFNKNGYTTLPLIIDEKTKHIKIGGDQRCAEVFLRLLYNKTNDVEKIVYLSPLDQNHVESIYINNLILAIDNNNYNIDASIFFTSLKQIQEETKSIQTAHNEMLLTATKWFTKASNLHFELEDIYRRCMDFSNNDEIFDKIYKKTLKVFDC